MAYDIQITPQPDYLYVQVSGQRVPHRVAKDALAMWQRIAEACQRTASERVLCVTDLKGTIPTMAAYDTGNSVADLFHGMRVKAAYVVNDEQSLETNAFGQTVAINRGFYVKLFVDEAEAREWLFQD